MRPRKLEPMLEVSVPIFDSRPKHLNYPNNRRDTHIDIGNLSYIYSVNAVFMFISTAYANR